MDPIGRRQSPVKVQEPAAEIAVLVRTNAGADPVLRAFMEAPEDDEPETPEEAASDVAGIVKETMENVFPLSVPLAVDAHWGKSWYDAKE